MPQTKQIYRDACRRSHRILGTYLALWAWRKRVDCIALDHGDLLPQLGLRAMRDQRLRWLAEDIKDIFPHQEPLTLRGTGGHGSLYLSRLRFPNGAFDDSMRDDERVKLLKRHGLRAALARLPTEERMTVALAIAAAGGGRRK